MKLYKIPIAGYSFRSLTSKIRRGRGRQTLIPTTIGCIVSSLFENINIISWNMQPHAHAIEKGPIDGEITD